MKYAAFIQTTIEGEQKTVMVMPPVGRKYGNVTLWPTMTEAQKAVEKKGRRIAGRGVVYEVNGQPFLDRAPDWSIAL